MLHNCLYPLITAYLLDENVSCTTESESGAYNVKSIRREGEQAREGEELCLWCGFYILTGGKDDLTAACTMQKIL